MGFRVIEDGRSGKAVVVNSVELADNFKKRHDNVLADINAFLETNILKFQEVDLCLHFRKSTHVHFVAQKSGWERTVAERCKRVHAMARRAAHDGRDRNAA
jgi:phage regulator Rha-like protein